jgi:hypothetical protein
MGRLDTSIYNQIEAPKFESPLNSLAQVLPVAGMLQKNKLMQRDMAEQDALKQAAKDAFDPTTGKLDASKYSSALGQGGHVKQLNEFETQQREQKKAQIKEALDKFGVIGQLMGGVRDQSSYDSARQQAASILGPDAVANISPVYNPREIEANRVRALSVKEQLEQQMKQLEFGEKQRHHKATESVSWANHGLSKQRLNMEQSAPKGQIIQTDKGTMIVDPRSGTAQPVTGPDGKPLVGAGKAPTEFQGKSAAFGARADLADKTITGLTGKYSPVAINSKMAVESTPLIGGIIGAATNKMALSQNDQKAEQAQRDFVNAILRQESGAVISDTEFDNARKQYFPQPGDGAEVVAQKAKNRKTAIEGLKRNAGSAAFTPSDADAGGLSPAEQKELDQLRARFGKK